MKRLQLSSKATAVFFDALNVKEVKYISQSRFPRVAPLFWRSSQFLAELLSSVPVCLKCILQCLNTS